MHVMGTNTSNYQSNERLTFLATHVPENNVPLALLWVKMTIGLNVYSLCPMGIIAM